MNQTTTPQIAPRQTFLSKLVDFARTGGGDVLHYSAPAQSTNLLTDRIKQALAQNETSTIKGNPYAFSQKSGKKMLGGALGKYQVTAGELKTYGPRFLGATITPQQFLASPSAQEKYIANKIEYYAKQGYTPQQIADIHRSGVTKAGNPGDNKYQSPTYVKRFNSFYFPPLTKGRSVPSATLNRSPLP